MNITLLITSTMTLIFILINLFLVFRTIKQKTFELGVLDRVQKQLETSIKEKEETQKRLEKEQKRLLDEIDELKGKYKALVEEKLIAMREEEENFAEGLALVTRNHENKIQNIEKTFEDFKEFKTEQMNALDLCIDEKAHELIELKEKINSINLAVLETLKEAQTLDFKRILLPEENVEDIHFLLEVEKKINVKEGVRKLVFDYYVKPSLNEMLKRVLENKEFPGIYKITDSDGRAYIGRAVNIKARWTSHCKEALGIGKISHSEIHNALRKRGWEDFTFEVLEQCDKEKLNEREKFYIDIFETNKYGYNMKKGG